MTSSKDDVIWEHCLLVMRPFEVGWEGVPGVGGGVEWGEGTGSDCHHWFLTSL